jgi:uncharacterized protein (TIGR02996 family)
MTDEDAFVQALLAAPGDTSLRLVYADWLEERGDPRGEYLRLLVLIDTSSTAEQLTDEVIERFRHLEKQINLHWLGLVNRGRIRKRQQRPEMATDARRERRRSRGEVLEAQIGIFLRQYARRSKYCSGPNDRSYCREVENKVKRMNAEYFDRLLRGDET